MKNKVFAFTVLICSAFTTSCSDNKEEPTSIVGTWNATSLTEDVVYTDLGKEVHNNIDIDYGSYIWDLEENKNVKITGNDGGSYQWYNKGEKPTEYQSFILDNSQMKLLFNFSDSLKSSVIYDVLELSKTEMVLRNTATWLIVGSGEAIITRTISFDRIN